IEGLVRIAAGEAGLPRIAVKTELAEAHIYLHGAHITHFQPRGARPVLFMSDRSDFAPGKPIRGGVPVIFPWFGDRADDAAAPKHGFVRLLPWKIDSIQLDTDDDILITLSHVPDETARKLWGKSYALRYVMSVG